MSRSRYQPGPANDHYHNALGPDQSDSSGVVVDDGVGALDAELHITGPDPTGNDVLRIEAPEGYHQSLGDGYLIHVFAGDGTDILNFDPSGAMNISSSVEEGIASQVTLANGGTAGETTNIRAGRSGGSTDRITITHGSSVIFRVLNDGAPITAAHSATADGTLLAGQMEIWFDQTNGAAKLMIKGKTANGSVVTGSVNLT